jgi:excisionase family DNA binding protein
VSDHEPLIGVEEASAYLGVPVRTLHGWTYRGEGPRSYRIGRHKKYRLSDIDAFIEAQANKDDEK